MHPQGHLSEILCSKGKPTLGTVVKLAKALEIDVKELFLQPEKNSRDCAIELILQARPETLRRVIGILKEDAEAE